MFLNSHSPESVITYNFFNSRSVVLEKFDMYSIPVAESLRAKNFLVWHVQKKNFFQVSDAVSNYYRVRSYERTSDMQSQTRSNSISPLLLQLMGLFEDTLGIVKTVVG